VNHPWWPLILRLAAKLDEAGVPYSFDAGTAMFLQGMETAGMDDIDISVQWESLPAVHQCFVTAHPTEIRDFGGWAKFRFVLQGVPVDILSYKGTVVTADPDRVLIQRDGAQLWAKSLDFFRRNLPPDAPRQQAIARLLRGE
jgi:hypothetical protein